MSKHKLSYDYLEIIKKQVDYVLETEQESILEAAELLADTIISGGMMHVYGAGHSHAMSMELVHRAGGLVPIKAIDEAGRGLYQEVEGVGTRLMEVYDLQENDCVLITSNSSRNPTSVEVALYAKNMGVKVMTAYSKEFAELAKSRHSSGKKVYELADIKINNYSVEGDATMELDGVTGRIGPTSTIINAIIYNWIVVEAIKIMKSKGHDPEILRSVNYDGGTEYNKKLLDKYRRRLYYREHIKN